MKFTIIGGNGFIGSHLVEYLKERGVDIYVPARNDPSIFSRPLGHLIYCAGYTADFRSKLLETVEAHVCLLRRILADAQFDSLVYLSSTRVYQRVNTAQEDVELVVDPHDSGDIYNLSKLMGESLCLSTFSDKVRVVRLSNVYGPKMGRKNFLGMLIYDALEKNEIHLKTSLSSSKDYIFIDDLSPLLVKIAQKGKKRVYNVGSGINVTNQTLMDLIMKATGCRLFMDEHPISVHFPPINIEQIKREFHFIPTLLESKLMEMIEHFNPCPNLNYVSDQHGDESSIPKL